MRQILLMLLLSPVLLFGFTNLKINNTSTPSVSVNDSLKLTGNFEGGDTSAVIKFYYDANQNLTLDSGDKLITFYRIYDGSPFDDDEIQNGSYSGYIPSIPIPMYAFILAQDSGGSDTIPVVVNPLSSSVTVSGNVTAGGNPAEKVLVIAEALENVYGAFTGTDGAYTIYLPDSSVGDTCDIMFVDFVGNNPGYLGSLDTLILTGSDTINSQMTLNDGTTLSGYIMDNMGDTLKDTFDFFIGGGYLNGTTVKSAIAQTFATDGSYDMELIKGSYLSEWQIDYSFISEMLYPLYTERKDTTLIVSGNTNFNIVLYKNDSYIRGHVYVNGNGVDTFGVKCFAVTDTMVGYMNTITYSDGRYILPVSSASDSYRVYIDVPDGFSCDTPSVTAAYGDTGVDFYLTQTGINSTTPFEKRKLRISYLNGKLLVSGSERNAVVSVYNITGSKLFLADLPVGNSSFDLNLKKGIYFAIVRDGRTIVKKKIISLK